MDKSLNDFEDDIEDRVWDIIFDSWYKFNLEGCDSQDQQFIKDRTIFINRDDPTNQQEVHNSIENFLWYSAENDEEIGTALEIEDWFNCSQYSFLPYAVLAQ